MSHHTTPTMIRIKAKELHVDFEVQREEQPAQCKKLAREWDDRYVGNLTASLRDGKFYLIDGQQRCTTKVKYMDDPDYEFNVVIHEHLTHEDEGRMFLAMNRDHKAVSAWDKYKVAVNVGQPDETAVDRIVRKKGFIVGAATTESVIGCSAALVRIYKAFGPDVLSDVIDLNDRMGYPTGLTRGTPSSSRERRSSSTATSSRTPSTSSGS